MKKKSMLNGLLLACTSAFILSACQSVGHRNPVEIKKELSQAHESEKNKPLKAVPDSVAQELMGGETFPDAKSQGIQSEKRLRVNANNVEIKAFFGSLLNGTGYSVVLHPDVKGRVTLALKDVTVQEALNVVSDIYGYNIEIKGKMVQIFPATLRTETFTVDYLQIQRSGISLTSISSGAVSGGAGNGASSSAVTTGGTVIETRSESDFWVQLEKAVSSMIGTGDGRNIVTSPQASLITVKAFPAELREVKTFLNASQKRLKRQVMLEAKILEVTLSDGYQQGINWQNISNTVGNRVVSIARPVGSALAGNAISAIVGGQTNVTISDGHFSAVMSFLDTQGDVNVLSSPRVTTANNQKAVIKVGGDEYFVTDISFADAIGDNSDSGPNIELTPFFSGISLDVTPQIDDDNGVLLHVHPAVVDVITEEKKIQLGSSSQPYILPLAKTSIRESDSVIHAKSGDVVVIGGLMTTRHEEVVSKIPLLGDLPGIGALFRNVNRIKHKTELVILIKPSVVGDDTWKKELKRSRDLLDEWFPES